MSQTIKFHPVLTEYPPPHAHLSISSQKNIQFGFTNIPDVFLTTCCLAFKNVVLFSKVNLSEYILLSQFLCNVLFHLVSKT